MFVANWLQLLSNLLHCFTRERYDGTSLIISGAKNVGSSEYFRQCSIADVSSKGERDRSSLETRLSPHDGAGRTNTFPVYNLELGKRETFARGVSDFRQINSIFRHGKEK